MHHHLVVEWYLLAIEVGILGLLFHAADIRFRNVHLCGYKMLLASATCSDLARQNKDIGLYFCIWIFIIELNMKVSMRVSQNIFRSFFLLPSTAYLLYGRKVKSGLFINSFTFNCGRPAFTRCTVFCHASCCNVFATMRHVLVLTRICCTSTTSYSCAARSFLTTCFLQGLVRISSELRQHGVLTSYLPTLTHSA